MTPGNDTLEYKIGWGGEFIMERMMGYAFIFLGALLGVASFLLYSDAKSVGTGVFLGAVVVFPGLAILLARNSVIFDKSSGTFTYTTASVFRSRATEVKFTEIRCVRVDATGIVSGEPVRWRVVVDCGENVYTVPVSQLMDSRRAELASIAESISGFTGAPFIEGDKVAS
ncbi:MAG: hypothetical protein NUW37_15135 [Planctomycetes bacterium]|nr:hypothetical protein [Planctomycetota bacterium]